ncbi:Transcriptional regulator, TetR family [Alloactinosynnema sp. L-07]|uniref:TetR/AcrR family transcriptional regulator n=1 Tax=Alloactinosynnema sp. L-07 TaxID=1653480 RepID=UPI00065EFCF2|nr:TetR/AcrR family transcriptional regulator [Alloactinosynnema sp. L-07]CRK59506.1 Transcriptional regulator, TetR family [Alloactinosynnema sp. L-07]
MRTSASVDKPKSDGHRRIVTEALRLTREEGVENWTLRRLAGAVGAYPAVVYHHVGDREAVVAEVIDAVVAEVALPDERLRWREWFEELLTGLRPVLRGAPGVARRLALHGPGVPSALPIIEAGVRVLRAAGFGDESVVVYELLLNQACLFVAFEDDRDLSPGIRERSAELFSSYRDSETKPGLAALGRYAAVADPAEFFGYAIARTLDGVAVRLADRPVSTPA